MATPTQIQSRSSKMLKDFLQDNLSSNYNNSCSSTGFNSYPRTLPENTTTSAATHTLPRSRSKSRAAAELVFGKLLNAVKSAGGSTRTPLRFLGIGWSTVKKKRERKTKCCSDRDEVIMNSKIVVVTVKVKDILRWKSFRDLVIDNHNHVNDDEVCEVEESEPLDFVVGPTEDAPEFTVTDTAKEVEELPCWSRGENLDDIVSVASDTDVGPRKDNHNINMASEEEKEQQSPVSVLESPFRDEVSDEEFLSSFDKSLANMERTKQRLLQSIHLFESLAGVHEEDEVEEDEEEDKANEAKSKAYLSRGLCWFQRGGKGLEEKIECIKGMDEQRHWGKFQEERVELGVELEIGVLSDVLDEVLIDF